ncbi:MAG TPA: GNAT family N-acetyltransferase [Acidimicrobiales bacterium]|jgi:GNAT superfamily N-acetyltransferase|nr:GNAT family N-acetyltransferase [Acidimicrobiales bacterium]
MEARQATDGDIRPLATVLARAFHDDPVMTWLFGERPGPRLRRLRRWFASEARRHRRHGQVLVGDGHEGAAFWDPPGLWKSGWREMLRAAPVMVPAVGPRIPRAIRAFDLIERAHPREHHWYLSVLGTDPPHQGRGVGTALVDPVLARCDREGLGAYLESSKPQNIPYYERFGFGVTGQIDLPSGPPVWPMWRDPQPPRS